MATPWGRKAVHGYIPELNQALLHEWIGEVGVSLSAMLHGLALYIEAGQDAGVCAEDLLLPLNDAPWWQARKLAEGEPRELIRVVRKIEAINRDRQDPTSAGARPRGIQPDGGWVW